MLLITNIYENTEEKYLTKNVSNKFLIYFIIN